LLQKHLQQQSGALTLMYPMGGWWFWQILVFLLFTIINTVDCQEYYLGNLTDTSREQFYSDLTSNVLAIQYHIQIGNETVIIYITSNTRLLTLSPESRFYSFGTIHSGFKFSVCNYYFVVVNN
jgi:hypothetical protein